GFRRAHHPAPSTWCGRADGWGGSGWSPAPEGRPAGQLRRRSSGEKDVAVADDPPAVAASVQVNDAAGNADGDRFGAVRGVELLEDMQDVHLDGGLRHREDGADLLVAQAAGHVGEDLPLAR